MAKSLTTKIENDSCNITINGVTMTLAAYQKQLKEKKAAEKKATAKKTTRRKKAEKKEISLVAEEIGNLIKQVGVLKSVQVYRNHAYRSWGTIADEILAYRGIRKPMNVYCVRFGEMNTLIEEVEKMSKRNEKAAYQFVEKIAWKLDDMKTSLSEMMSAVNESEVCNRFKNHEAINGKGRQLGLGTIVKKCSKAMPKIEEIIERLKEIAYNGVDVMNYGSHMSFRTKKRCWA